MAHIVLITLVCLSLGSSLYIGIYTLFQSQSRMKNYFLLMQTMIILYLFGHLLEITSTNAEEAYTAVKILYLGAYFASVFLFFFIADYCSVKIPLLFVKIPLLVIAAVLVLTMWTTRFHGLVYSDYQFLRDFSSRLAYTPGGLHSLVRAFPIICMLGSMALLCFQIRKSTGAYRRQLCVFFICVIIPFGVEFLYYLSILTGLNPQGLYPTPYSIALMSVCLYVGVLRFSVFEVISAAAVTAMEHIREGFVLLDNEGNYLMCNPAAAVIFPGLRGLSRGDSLTKIHTWPEEFKQTGRDFVDFTIDLDEIKHFQTSISPVYSKKKETLGNILLFRDMTDNMKLMKELENAAYIDSLTGIYNRKHFTELANVEIERARRANQLIYMAMLDLDFFKMVNDTHGHAAGDQVLRRTAEIVRQTIRPYDLLGRYGGEEFLLLVTHTDPTEPFKQMERIRRNMERSIITYEDIPITITCSIGLAQFKLSDSFDATIKRADAALYAAKNSGRNNVKEYTLF
ncbi:MAG: diguanylate cyclase [Treponema sp.]|nr:diguanylate cyclase [Treponema sp.]